MEIPLILAQNLSKTFTVAQKDPGLAGTLKHFISRRYLRIAAVRDVSFELQSGEIVGFLGPNGAGKTTTLKMLSGLVRPSEGRVRVLGFEPFRRCAEFLRQITLVMGNKQQLIWDLPVLDSLRINAAVYQIDGHTAKERAREFAALLGLQEILTQPVRKLSLGQRMKAELMASLFHLPKVLFLDEPTLGLDVNAQLAVRDFLKTYRDRYGATILLTSHYMADIEALAERVIVLHRGGILYDGALRGLTDKFSPFREVDLELADDVAAQALAGYGEARKTQRRRYRILVHRQGLMQALAEIMARFDVRDLAVKEPPLDEIIAKVFSEGEV